MFRFSSPAVLLALLMLDTGCAPSLVQRQTAASAAVEALRGGQFEQASSTASLVLEKDSGNPFAHLVAAISRYRTTMHQLATDIPALVMSAAMRGSFNHQFMRFSLEQANQEFARVEADLAAVASSPEASLELCPACWKVDWNRSGKVDKNDEKVFQIEMDENGEELPEGDPRRTPTFRFDYGDILWARAFVSFQRAAIDILLAYKWSDIGDLRALWSDEELRQITIKLEDPARIEKARQLILSGLGFANDSRKAYLAEIDDDREWLPNPRQKSHPMPLPVDDALFETWEMIVGDLQRLVAGEEGLSVAQLAQLGEHQWENPPKGFLDFGGMLLKPKDLVINVRELEIQSRNSTPEAVETMLQNLLGGYYVPVLKPSPLIERIQRMKSEVSRGQESFERKLRYMFWLN